MIPEIGQIALTLALMTAIVQGIIPIWGAARQNPIWMRSAAATSVLQCILIAVAFAALMRSFMVSDFTVVNVVENSNSLKPMLFKIAGTWGSHEGSLLLWSLILAVFGAAVAVLGQNIPLPLKARTLSVQAWISIGFLSFMLFTSNPFDRVFPPPLDGNDLNPLLQDVGLALHPPLLYFGYVGFSIVFSFAVAALIEGRVDPAWARWVRPWTLAAWISLTAGMAILTFSMSLLGTFIVRSGVLTSVHAFAVDPARGLYIIGLLALAIGGSLTLYAVRAPKMEPGGLFTPVSREGGLLINNLLLGLATAVVLFGTLYPLFLEALTGDKISVGPPFFNSAFLPIALPLVIIMAIGPFLSWKRADLPGVVQRMKWVLAMSVLGLLVVWYFQTGGPALAIVSVLIAFWLLFATLREWALRIKLGQEPLRASLGRMRRMPRASHGMTLAHLGLAVLMLGMIGSSAWKSEEVLFVEPGAQVSIAGFDVTFEGVTVVRGPNYIAQVGALKIMRDGKDVGYLNPERRTYPVAQSQTTEAGIRSTLAGDLYASITEPADESATGKWTLRILYEPFVGFIWLGSIMMVLGGLISLSDRRLRVGAPRSRPQPAPEAVAAE